MAEFYSIPLYGTTTFYLSIYLCDFHLLVIVINVIM